MSPARNRDAFQISITNFFCAVAIRKLIRSSKARNRSASASLKTSASAAANIRFYSRFRTIVLGGRILNSWAARPRGKAQPERCSVDLSPGSRDYSVANTADVESTARMTEARNRTRLNVATNHDALYAPGSVACSPLRYCEYT